MLHSHSCTYPKRDTVLDFDAVIIGAGVPGLYQLYRLRELESETPCPPQRFTLWQIGNAGSLVPPSIPAPRRVPPRQVKTKGQGVTRAADRIEGRGRSERAYMLQRWRSSTRARSLRSRIRRRSGG